MHAPTTMDRSLQYSSHFSLLFVGYGLGKKPSTVFSLSECDMLCDKPANHPKQCTIIRGASLLAAFVSTYPGQHVSAPLAHQPARLSRPFRSASSLLYVSRMSLARRAAAGRRL